MSARKTINPTEFKNRIDKLTNTVREILQDVSDDFNNYQLKDWSTMQKVFKPADRKTIDEFLEIYRIPLRLDHTVLFHVLASNNSNKDVLQVGPHYHDFIEIIYPVNCTMYDKFTDQSFDTIYYIPPGIVHDIEVPKGSEYYVLLIKPPVSHYLRLEGFPYITSNAHNNK